MSLHLIAIAACMATMPNYQLSDKEVVECKLYMSECVSVNYNRFFSEPELIRHCAKQVSEKYWQGYIWCL